MERLAWLEIVDRHGDVSARHPVHAWPLRIGRAYSNDIILDDPYVAPSHLEIDRVENGNFHFRIIDSINAMTVDKRRNRETEATLPSNEIVRIGQTQLRIRPVGYTVPAEKSLPNVSWSRSWTGLSVGIAALLLVQLAVRWLNYNSADGYNILVTPLFGIVFALLLWSGFWALIGRVASGRANFIAHAVNASLWLTLLIFLETLDGYVDFALDTGLMTQMAAITGPLIIGALIYRHMRLVSRLSRRKLVTIITTFIASFIGFGHISDHWNAEDHLADMEFSRTIGPPALSLARELSAESFIGEADKLKADVDRTNHDL